jgi:MEDS: MEthanogen/methylotroph, DcmR Sensory domain/Histidine kinase-like ATPase domain
MVGDGEHVVQFYDDDTDLVQAVGRYLVRAIGEGSAAIVIASEPHWQAFEAELVGAGIDVADATADGTIAWLDAARTLSLFVDDEGRIDPAAFRLVIGGVVGWARGGGRAVRAYGEMVGLLWDAGDVLGAIELEKLWNELSYDLNFGVWCGYRAKSVAGGEHADALHEVCHLHTAVVDDATARFRAGPDAPFAARRFVTSLLGCRPYDNRAPADDAQLVVSELTTNAVVHAGSPFSVSVRYDGSAVRIAVHDWNPTLPVLRDAGPTAISGRGLHLVNMLARDWGVEPSPDGKTVWADLPLR